MSSTGSTKKLVLSVINMRKRLLDQKLSGKNSMLCHRYIRELKVYIDAYGNKWDDNGWKSFLRRNLDMILYLVPENKSGESLKKRICDETL